MNNTSIDAGLDPQETNALEVTHRVINLYRRYVPRFVRLPVRRHVIKPLVALLLNRWKTSTVFLFILRELQLTHTMTALLLADAREYVQNNRLELGLATAEKCLYLDPTSQRAIRLKVSTCIELGMNSVASQTVTDLLQLYPLDVFGFRRMQALGMMPPERSLQAAREHIVAKGNSLESYVSGVAYLYDAELFGDCEALINEAFAYLHLVQMRHSQAAPREIVKNREELNHYLALVYEQKHLHHAAMYIFNRLHSSKFRKKAAEGIVRCLHECGQFEAALAVLLGDKNAKHLPFRPLNVEALQAAGLIQAAYSLYRKRPFSRALAQQFNQPAPVSLKLKSPAMAEADLFIVAEGGPGDELRMATVYDDLHSRSKSLTISCDPRLYGLMKRSFPRVHFVPAKRHRAEFATFTNDRNLVDHWILRGYVSDRMVESAKACDVVCSILDALCEYRPNKKAFANTRSGPLLAVDAEKYAKWQTEVDPNVLNIGIAWRSILRSVARNTHYFNVEQLTPLGSLSNCRFWILQPGLEDQELTHLQSYMDVYYPDQIDFIDDFEEQAALIANLDVVVSPFATTGELAGTLGIKTLFLAASEKTTWRQYDDGTDIWHPQAEIIRSEPVYDKDSTVLRCRDRLERLQSDMQKTGEDGFVERSAAFV